MLTCSPAPLMVPRRYKKIDMDEVTISLRSGAGQADYKTDHRPAGRPWTTLDSAPRAPKPQV
jgi:hypothetical protein